MWVFEPESLVTPARQLSLNHMDLSPILMELHFIHQLIDEKNPATMV